MRNFFYFFIITAVIAGGIYILVQKDQTQPVETSPAITPTTIQQPTATPTETPQQNAQETATVRYTNTGFEPANLTVPAGTTVTFINESDSSMWVASDEHPVHAELLGFDQLSSGSSYAFTFTETGVWGYHNHLRSNHTGTITIK